MKTQQATFAAGCFWGVQASFDKVPGVVKTTVGYTGGKTPDPTYPKVCQHDTGHAEAVLVEFDPTKVSYPELLDAFWSLHDPTTVDRDANLREDQKFPADRLLPRPPCGKRPALSLSKGSGRGVSQPLPPGA